MDLSKAALQARVNKALEGLSKDIADEMMEAYPDHIFTSGMGNIAIFDKDGNEVAADQTLSLWRAQYSDDRLRATLTIENYLP